MIGCSRATGAPPAADRVTCQSCEGLGTEANGENGSKFNTKKYMLNVLPTEEYIL